MLSMCENMVRNSNSQMTSSQMTSEADNTFLCSSVILVVLHAESHAESQFAQCCFLGNPCSASRKKPCGELVRARGLYVSRH